MSPGGHPWYNPGVAYASSAVLRLERAKETLNAGRPSQAFRLLSAAVPLPLRPERDFLRAEALRSQGFFLRSAVLYARILIRVNPEGEPDLWLESCLALASVRRSLGDAAAARSLLSRGHAAAKRARRPVYRERLELESALVDRAEGRYKKSIARLRRLLSVFRGRGDWSAAGFVLWAMGGARRFAGDLAGSERDFRSALTVFRRARDESGRAYALFGLGGVTRIRGRLGDSERWYAEAARRLDGTDDVFGRAYAQCGLANVLRQKGELEKARVHYLRSHKLYSLLGDEVDLAYVDWGLGKVALQRGELREAESRLWRSLSSFARHRETRGEVLAETALAAVLHARGRTARAEGLFTRAVRRARAAGLHAHLEVFT